MCETGNTYAINSTSHLWYQKLQKTPFYSGETTTSLQLNVYRKLAENFDTKVTQVVCCRVKTFIFTTPNYIHDANF